MRMNDPVFFMICKKRIKLFQIPDIKGIKSGKSVNPTSERLDLPVIIRYKVSMHQKVKLNFIPIDIAIIVHQHGLKSAISHICNYL